MSHELKTPLEIVNQEATQLMKSNMNSDDKSSVNTIKIASEFINNFACNMIQAGEIEVNHF